MTGMERNSDVVVMASYAPLFVNVGWRQWNPDTIQFDNSRACGTPSYWVQQMFSETRGDVVLPLELDAPGMPLGGKGGGIGVGTWSTQAEFKDIRVTAPDGKFLCQSDFADGSHGWRGLRGQWAAADGLLRQTSQDTDCRNVLTGKRWPDYTYSLKARKLSGQEGFLILFNRGDDNTRSWWNLGGWGNVRHGLEVPGVPIEAVPGRIETGRWYDIRIEVNHGRLRCYLDGKLIHDFQPKAPSMYAVASKAADGGVLLKIVNASARPQNTAITLAGMEDKNLSGTATVLAGARLDAENTLDAPAHVVPVTTSLSAASANFSHEFPPYSVTVLRLHPAP
jgi:alpha-L-arabinofuranosidase